jgi:hypothetical protein
MSAACRLIEPTLSAADLIASRSILGALGSLRSGPPREPVRLLTRAPPAAPAIAAPPAISGVFALEAASATVWPAELSFAVAPFLLAADVLFELRLFELRLLELLLLALRLPELRLFVLVLLLPLFVLVLFFLRLLVLDRRFAPVEDLLACAICQVSLFR